MKILLDTTHVMPFFGVETSIVNHKEGLKELLVSKGKNVDEILISDITLLEIKWLMIKQAKKEEQKEKKKELERRFRENMKIISESKTVQIVNWYKNSQTIEIADKCQEMGHKDYLDCLMIGQSKSEEAIFITEDKEIEQLVKKTKREINVKAITWETLMERIK